MESSGVEPIASPSDGERGEREGDPGVQLASPRQAAVAADGERVSARELEGAAEFARLPLRLGMSRHRTNGFRLYRGYLAIRRVMLALRSSSVRRPPDGGSNGI